MRWKLCWCFWRQTLQIRSISTLCRFPTSFSTSVLLVLLSHTLSSLIINSCHLLSVFGSWLCNISWWKIMFNSLILLWFGPQQQRSIPAVTANKTERWSMMSLKMWLITTRRGSLRDLCSIFSNSSFPLYFAFCRGKHGGYSISSILL